MSIQKSSREERERIRLIHCAVKSILEKKPELKGEPVSLLYLQKAIVSVCEQDEQVVPQWIYSRSTLGRWMKHAGYFQKKTKLRCYRLDPDHAEESLNEIEELESVFQKNRIDVTELLTTIAQFRYDCASKLDLKLGDCLSYEDQINLKIKLKKFMLVNLDKIDVKFRGLMRELLTRSIKTSKASLEKLPEAPG